jgi:membrane fusion protein, multidrug efflux system
MRTGHIAAGAALLIVAGLAGWLVFGRETARSAAPPADSAIPVTAGIARAEDVPVYVQGVGTVQAINTVNVKSRVDGQIVAAYFEQGQEVKQGDKLFLIDPRPYQAALDQAKANEAKDAAQLQGAQRNMERYGKLVPSGFQSRQSYEDQQATVAQMQGAVQADRAAIETAQLNLGFATILAPLTGRTGARLVDPGNVVQANAGTVLTSITQVRPIHVGFTLPASNFAAIHREQATHKLVVHVIGEDGTTRLATGALSFIDNHVDTSTGTIALKAEFANADETLWPGAFVNARLILSTRHDAITVPVATVMTGPNGNYVYVIGPDSTVQRRDVEVASRQDGIAVIGKGLAAGERVVVEGQYRLANNMRVRIERGTSG